MTSNLKKKLTYSFYVTVFLLLILTIILKKRIIEPLFQKKYSFINNIWKKDTKLNLSFNLKTNENHNSNFSLYLNLIYNEKYPYNNLFIKYTILDYNSRIVKSEIIEYKILDEVTGKPFGKGIWKNKRLFLEVEKKLQLPITQNFNKFNILFEQYMRKDLSGIKEITIQVYKNNNQ